jgi:aminopeptidase N
MVLLQRRPPMLRGGLMDDPTNFSDVPDFFFAHELAHQWWGHGVAGQNYRERWLSEGAAHYAAALWVRRSQGEATFRDVLRRMARWAFRHGDEGPLILGYRLGHLKGNPQVFRAVAYDKGAYVLHMLRGIVGEEAFRRALVQFQAEHRFSKAGSDDLREALQAASGKELEAYFHDWVYGTRLPSLHVSSRSAKAPSGFETVVDVRAQHLPGPVPVEVSVDYPGGRAARKVLLAPEGGRFTIETPGMPGKVEVNSDRGLLATIEKG